MSEAVVVGGGIAGGAVATLLARAGARVTLLEREREPVDKVCGEFLSGEAQRTLASLGVDLDSLGASRIATLRLASGDRMVEAPLPFVARGLTRRRLDAALLDRAAGAGARVERGVTVRVLAGGRLDTTAGTLAPATLLLASGKHEVRGATRTSAGCDTGYVGFKTHWRPTPRARAELRGMIDVVLFDGGYAGLQLVEEGLANLCLLVTRERLDRSGGGWAGLWEWLVREPRLASLLGDAEQVTPRPLAISGVPYGFVHRGADGPFRLGDQAAVIPSFCGEGMAIALRSATIAASVLAGGGAPGDHHARLRREVLPRVRLAMAVQRLGQRPSSRFLLWHALRLAPSLATRVARLTRVPQ
ncbi:NAD(P)/FAD-dependent oxidoreductase [Sphingomonas sp.]|uniref:NAD(P)/FAD-dependent oxidoreductase n=1 Tax=Sphingomonas sp. TaxID=28214 RepID=UPI003B00436B